MSAQQRRYWGKGMIFVLVLVLSMISLEGCGTLETLLKKDDTSTSATIGGWVGNTNSAVTEPVTAATADGISVGLYFPDTTGKYLLKEERILPKTLSLARETVNQWLSGPSANSGSVQAATSPNTSLVDINLKDGVITVDLTRDFLKPYNNVAPEATIYGLVDTLTQFSTINEVKVRIEGKELNSYGGLDITHLSKDASLVKGVVSGQSNGVAAGDNAPGLTDSPSSINLFDYSASPT